MMMTMMTISFLRLKLPPRSLECQSCLLLFRNQFHLLFPHFHQLERVDLVYLLPHYPKWQLYPRSRLLSGARVRTKKTTMMVASSRRLPRHLQHYHLPKLRSQLPTSLVTMMTMKRRNRLIMERKSSCRS
jgi:hypothetical protein